MEVILDTDPKLEYRNEYDLFSNVYYDDNPFTGIIQEELGQTEYLDGYAHGKYISKYKNGAIETESIFQKGEEIESKSFYQTGEKKSISNEKEYKLWTKEGILIYETDYISGISKSYFVDGSLKLYQSKNKKSYITKYYDKQGNCILIQFPHNMEELEIITSYDEEKLLMSCFELIVKEHISELEYCEVFQDKEKHRIHLIWMWLWHVFDKNQKLYFSIINNLMTHYDKDTLKDVASIIAIHKFERFIASKDKANSVCYALIEEYRAYQDKYYPDRECKKVIV